MTRDERNARERAYYAANKERICARRRARISADRETVNAKMREYQRNNRDKYYEYNAANRFGVKRADIQAIRASADVCEICGNPPAPTKRLAIDHDHATGKLRGLLCHTCNLGLGAFKDSETLLYQAFFYLMKHKHAAEVTGGMQGTGAPAAMGAPGGVLQ